jgi:Tfp pilus assembly protein PilZ
MSKSVPPESPDDLRTSDRVTINKEFESFDAFIQEYVTNISRSGVFVKSKQPLPIGTRVNLKFTVIMDDIETIEGVGEVVRVQNDPSGMGVVFRELSQYSQHLIERLLTAPASVIGGGAGSGSGGSGG